MCYNIRVVRTTLIVKGVNHMEINKWFDEDAEKSYSVITSISMEKSNGEKKFIIKFGLKERGSGLGYKIYVAELDLIKKRTLIKPDSIWNGNEPCDIGRLNILTYLINKTIDYSNGVETAYFDGSYDVRYVFCCCMDRERMESNNGIEYYSDEDFNALETYLIYHDSKYFYNTYNFPNFPSGLPKGYLEYLDSENTIIHLDTYSRFKLLNMNLNGLTKQKRTFLVGLNEGLTYIGKIRLCKMESVESYDKIYKIVLNSVRNGQFNSLHDVDTLLTKCYKCLDLIDTSKTARENVRILEKIARKDFYDRIATNLQKLNFLNGFTHADFPNLTVVIPQTTDDLVKEGESQHNCVGSFYDDEIANGEDTILFIRKKDNIEKSYITARYNYPDREIEEFRFKNNVEIEYDTEESRFISLLENEINKIFYGD